MQKIIIISCILALTSAVVAQQNPPLNQPSKEEYLNKSKDQKTTGWVLLGAGLFLTTVGIVKIFAEGSVGATGQDLILPALGIGLSLCSIPSFSSSRNNERKAAYVRFENRPLSFAPQHPSIINTQPTLTMKIVLN